ncbi:MAG TPA: DUF11 domain-containing protein, partial [Candidatus Limnocylindria bacterium]|nr:DUF11 domain-containing protein [Candidatus Limnocylindria bacterium]
LADVAITKTASVAQISVGSDFTYTLTITNLGPDTAQGVHLTDVMPPEVTFVSTTHPNTVSCGLFLKVVFDCAGGPLAGGQSIVITATVHTVASGQITNTANVTGTTADPVPGNNSATAVVSAHELGISDLVLQVHGISLDRGTATSLIAKLNAASDNLDAGDVAGACGALGAFGNEVQAQSGKKLTVNQAQTLGENATAVQATIGCR